MTLPQGWVEAAVADIVKPIETDDPAKTPDQTFRYVDIGSIDNSTLQIVEPKEIVGRDAPSRARRRIRAGDVLFSTVRPYLKNIAQVPQELDGEFTSTGICVLRASDGIEPGYIFRRVISQDFIDSMTLASDGTMYPAIADRDVFSASIALPPSSEQGRIVTKLDSLTARLARARAELDRVDALAHQQRDSVMAFQLNRWVGSATRIRFEQQIDVLTSGSRDWAKYYDKGSSVFVLAGNVRRLRFDPTPKRFVDPPLNSADARRSKIAANDLLVTIVGAGTGDICHVKDELDGYFVCQSVARIALRDPRLASFYAYWFASPMHGGGEFREAMYGAARPHLSFDQLKTFMVPDISAEIAATAVQAIELALARVDRLEAEAARARALLNRLEAAILAKAFRGELVPQDPNDEPASVLLDRIHAQRAAAPKSQRGRKRAAAATA